MIAKLVIPDRDTVQQLQQLADRDDIPVDRIMLRWQHGVRDPALLCGRLQPSKDWLTSKQVKSMLGVDVTNGHASAGAECLRRRSRSLTGASARRTGWLWWRADIERCQQIMRACAIPFGTAARVVQAENEGTI